MTQPKSVRSLTSKLAISPHQILVGTAGAACGLGALLSIGFGWPLDRDIFFVGMAVALMAAVFMLLRSLTLKITSVRRDILRLSQRQASATQRIEASAGLSGAAALSMSAEPVAGISLGRQGTYFGVGPEYEYARRAVQALPAYETFALRTRSLFMRDVFARAVTGLQFNYRDVLRLLRSGPAGSAENPDRVVGQWRVESLLGLARVVANQRVLPNDAATSVLLFEVVIRVFGASALGKTDRRLYLEALSDEGRSAEAEQWIKEFRLADTEPVHAALLTANLLRPDGSDSRNWTPWLGEINRILADEGAAPIGLSPEAGLPLDRLRACGQASAAGKSRKRDPLVTVIMPTHNGSEFIETALASLLAQTWKNLEIIVVDDCSAEIHVQRLKRICSSHDNILLLEQRVNGGAYLARNAALLQARGEFITVHDDDDWSHPEKVERQVEWLRAHPGRLANMTMHTRVTDTLSFLRVNNNTSFTQPNYSSLMFRRASVGLLGEWDAVNRGADAEFRDRIHNVFGDTVEVIGRAPMSFTRTRAGSLTHGELDRGYIEPARLIYLESYTQAHRRGVFGGSVEERKFAAPLDMLPRWRGQHKGEFDVVYATDFRLPRESTLPVIAEIRAAAHLGLRIGVLQLDSPLAEPDAGFSPALLELLLGDQAALLRMADSFDAALLVLGHAPAAQFLDNALSPAKIQRAILVVAAAPVTGGGPGWIYDVEQCVANVSRCFTVSPGVVPDSGVARELVQKVAGDVPVAGYDWPACIDLRDEVVRRAGAGVPLVGRHSRDHRLKWPDTLQEFLDAYYQPRTFSTRILGGIESIASSLPDTVRQDLAVTPFSGTDVREYLRELDFWVYFHSSRTTESLGAAAAEAMETGLVLILPHYMEATFGEGAVYALPSEVAAVINRFWEDPSLYEQQSRRARRYARDHYSAGAYSERLAYLTGREHEIRARDLVTDGAEAGL